MMISFALAGEHQIFGQWSHTFTTHISIDQNDHSFIIQF